MASEMHVKSISPTYSFKFDASGWGAKTEIEYPGMRFIQIRIYEIARRTEKGSVP
jgi:hypothetical protein